MNGRNSYQERISDVSVGEKVFEAYCKAKGYYITRLGFDERNNNVPDFFKINPFVRNLPDYYIINNGNSALVMVKGTSNIKEQERKMIPYFVEHYETRDCPLIYAFCFEGKEPIFHYPEKVMELYDASTDRHYPHDNKTYRNLNI